MEVKDVKFQFCSCYSEMFCASLSERGQLQAHENESYANKLISELERKCLHVDSF